MARMIPRKRTILGGTLAVGLVAGIFLSGKLPHLGNGIGLGTGGDGLLGKPSVEEVSVNVGDEAKSSAAHDDDEADNGKPPKPKRTDATPRDDVLTILVEDRHYAVWRKTRKGNGYFPVEVSEIVDLARSSQPNNDGIRVRILRTRSARVTAWQPLQAELVKAGIRTDEITVPKELVND